MNLEPQDLHEDEGSGRDKEGFRLFFRGLMAEQLAGIDEYLEAFKHQTGL